LLAFQRKLTEFDELKVQVVAASVDTLEEARTTRDRYSITYRLGYGLDAREIAAKTGAFFEKRQGFLHSTDFIVDPEGLVVNAVYSSGAIGRIVPEDCLGLIKYHMQE
jgi:peroxiredoxin